MAGISIPIATDTRQAVRGTDALADGFDKIADAIDDAGHDSESAGDKIERAMRDAQRETRDTATEFDKAGRKARDLGDNTQKGMHEAGGYTGEFKDEALANFSEVTSSFDGSMQSVVDLAQGTFGGLASLGGPVGLALGGLAALTGLAFSGMSASADQSAQEATERIQKMYDDMVESGNKFVSDSLINDSIKETVQDEGKLADVRQRAAEAGVSVQTALRAEAGDRDALNSVLDSAQQHYADISARIDEVVRNGGKVSGELQGQSGAAADLVQHYQGLIANQDTATAKADLYRQSTSNTAAAMADASSKAADLKGRLDAFHDVNVKVNVDDANAQEHLRQLGKAINVDMFVTPRTGRGIS